MTSWTDQEIETLLKMQSQGYTSQMIADRLGRSQGAVLSKIHHLGYSKPVVIKPKIKYTEEKTSFTRDLKDAGANECRYMEAIPMICSKAIHKRDMCQEHYDLCFRVAGRVI